MGRHHQHHLKLPDHLRYLTPPPTPPTSSNPIASSFLSVKSAVYPASSISILQDSLGARAVGDKIPGFKTSAAFFTTLRANLIIDLESPPPSYCSTPDLRPIHLSANTHLAPLPPSLIEMADSIDTAETTTALQATPQTLSDEPPPLTTTVAATTDSRVDVLKLIADSVAQQRQYGTTAILYHPLTVLVLTTFLLVIYHYFSPASTADYLLFGSTATGILMALLASTRLLTKHYITEAENVGTWKWLDRGRPDGSIIDDADTLLLTKFGERPIGAIILRAVRDNQLNTSANTSTSMSTGSNSSRSSTTTSSPTKRRTPNKSTASNPPTALIRGFAVTNKYRRKGVGSALIEEAVKVCKERGWEGPEVDPEHANSKRFVWGVFGGAFERRDARAKRLVERVRRESDEREGKDGGGRGKRRR